ncbi:MAG: NAD(P)-dependent oxidoreductase [Chloroflexota bacterium]|nr:NAD(P)-dependent oxidoreductase [Chloroflexota bacterium]
MSRKRLLLTGAAGGIGSAFFRATAEHYTFRLADRDTPSLISAESQGHEVCMLDVADLDACQQACRDIDVVIHLAATTNPEADFYQMLLQNNIQGAYNIFRAAKDQGCQRVIFASSAQVVAGYPDDVQAHPEAPLRPMNMYGVCKCFGEAVASYFAYAEGLSSIAVRIGSYDVNGDASNWLRQEPNVRHLSGYMSERDMNQLLMRCIETPDVQFAIVHGISNNRFKRLDTTSTRDLLGYAPQDDAFEIFQADLQTWLQG